MQNGMICLGAQAQSRPQTTDEVTFENYRAEESRAATGQVPTVTSGRATPGDKSSEKATKRQLTTISLTSRKHPPRTIFNTPKVTNKENQPDKIRLCKYNWHLVLNHATPEVLTKLARNPYIKIPSLDSITTTRTDTTCRACLEGKKSCTQTCQP